ncbi:hypothetical protein [Glutamicibacter sp. 2E12]|uniref:hypothetical protein n=1 Tax=Glutamicibacter sp. 2E12 TaxID=3416181 RepID=UPI003CF18EF7
MKKSIFAFAVVVALPLAGCSAPATAPTEATEQAQALESTSASPTPSPTTVAPDVLGETVAEGQNKLRDAGFMSSVSLTVPTELEEFELSEKITNKFEITSQENSSTEKFSTLEAEASEELLNDELAWIITCHDGTYSSDGIKDSFLTYKQVWKSKNYEEFTTCEPEFIGSEWSPNKLEKSVEKIAQTHWEGREEPEIAFGTAVEYCSIPHSEDALASWSSNMGRTMAKAALELCPDAPFAKEMGQWARGEKFDNGTYVVGDEIPAGTYRSSKKVSDCYWERTSPSGNTIANDFITHASAGALVTVRSGETFVAEEECGTWTKQ